MKELTCIVCPRGCTLQIDDASDALTVTGHSCKRGEAFARAELTNPMRALSTTVHTVFADMPRLPVKTQGEIPKGKMLEAMRMIKTVQVTKRLQAGDVVLPDVFGVPIIATASM